MYVALGVTLSGHKELLGLWIAPTEGAKFWLSVLTELKNRGMQDCFIACVDGLTGFPEAIETVFPKAQVQLCLVHKVRNSLAYVNYKDRRAVAKDLKALYTAPTSRCRAGPGDLCRDLGWALVLPSVPSSVVVVFWPVTQLTLHSRTWRIFRVN